EGALGHSFRNRTLLERALTHKSRVYEKNLQSVLDDNEQLEFLGDSILGFIVSELLVSLHPEYPEGRLSKLKAHLVSAS
ncbi:ribonuclease III domain-containing protein, partial [Klebsiella pneumoniae]|uniref:ribonuclease III domain-containing protein n=1 Tax=Klebsiella pneumoniae TaxID=573 RepID=UPI00301356E9